MKCAKEINCRLFADVYPNPDMGGIGVVLAFMIPAWCSLLVTLTVFFGFDSLKVGRNHLDHDIVQALRKLFKPIKNILKIPSTQVPVHPISRISLVFSDQQLITATAIFTAAFANLCDVDEYHFLIAYYMGAASFLTHQATVMVVKDVLKDYPLMRAWRMLWVLAIFALVFAANLAIYSYPLLDTYNVSGRPAFCLYNNIQIDFLDPYSNHLRATSVFWAWGFLAVVRDLCPELWSLISRLGRSASEFIYRKVAPLFSRVEDVWTQRVPRTIGRPALWVANKVFFIFFLVYITCIQLLTSTIVDIYRITTSLISITYSIWLLKDPTYFDHQWESAVHQDNSWGFGQMLAVIFLALPFFQILEILYYGCQPQIKGMSGISEQVDSSRAPAEFAAYEHGAATWIFAHCADPDGDDSPGSVQSNPNRGTTSSLGGRVSLWSDRFTSQQSRNMDGISLQEKLYQCRAFRAWMRFWVSGIFGATVFLTLYFRIVL